MERASTKSNIGNILIVAFLAVVGLGYLYGHIPARVSDVREVVTLASGNVEASEKVREFLAKNQEPKNFEILALKDEINTALVKATARDVAGNHQKKKGMILLVLTHITSS